MCVSTTDFPRREQEARVSLVKICGRPIRTVVKIHWPMERAELFISPPLSLSRSRSCDSTAAVFSIASRYWRVATRCESSRIESSRVKLNQVGSCCVVSCCLVSSRLVSCGVVSCRVVSFFRRQRRSFSLRSSCILREEIAHSDYRGVGYNRRAIFKDVETFRTPLAGLRLTFPITFVRIFRHPCGLAMSFARFLRLP